MIPIIKRRTFVAESIPSDAKISPLLWRIYAGRGITDLEQLNHSLSELHDVSALSGIVAATDILEQAIRNEQRIVIVADFDADGATSCAVAIRALKAMGCKHVSYIVPNRFEYGYGLTPPIVELAQEKSPDLIVTVDNGISSVAGVAAARAAGIDVLITDHHLPGRELPQANAIVNPNLTDDGFPSKTLAGVGVIFYVLLALRARLRETQWFDGQAISEPNLAELLDLVALGTVADVVPLDRNNRCLVSQGLARIRAGRTVTGITALLQVAGQDLRTVSSTDLGFILGPRLNAAGRLDDMSVGIECLLSDDPQTCSRYAIRLDQLNRERREIESGMKAQAIDLVADMQLDAASLPCGIALYDPAWHQGVIGIVASRIKDRVHRPVVAFAPADGGEIKGSGRSIPGIHMRDTLDVIATKHPDLLTKFGGHAMAAGLTIAAPRFDEFAELFAAEVAEMADETVLQQIIETDGALSDDEFDLTTSDLLALAAPWGQAFPAPLFDDDFEIIDRRIVGDAHIKMRLRRRGGNRTIDAIAFNAAENPWSMDANSIHAVYRLASNEYRGLRSVQLIIEYATALGVADGP